MLDSIKLHEYLKEDSSNLPVEIDLELLQEGHNDINDFFITVKEGKVESVVNRICDHAGGTLIRKANMAVCPLHNWELNLDTLKYTNGLATKNVLNFKVIDNKLLVDREKRALQNLLTPNDETRDVECRWLNHACVQISFNNFTVVTDPWLIGSAFLDGWWLKYPSTKDSIEILRESDAILISHNHPDHLNIDTLKLVGKDHLIIVPDYISKSAANYLKSFGFTNVVAIDFKKVVELSTGFKFCFLKSGDFRDDSGFYFSVNGFEMLLTVDSNFLNGHVLPKNIDLLMTSFAGGASGFPLCYDNYTGFDKSRILRRNKGAVLNMVNKYMELVNPLYYMPYAGMFEERALRDLEIKRDNVKNSYEEISLLCLKNNITFITPDSSISYKVKSGKLLDFKLKVDYLGRENCEKLIANRKSDLMPLSLSEVSHYFKQSGFNDNQLLYLILCEDDFKANGQVYSIDFSNDIVVEKIELDEIMYEHNSKAVMVMRVRVEALSRVIREMLPWEDISIGFQMRVQRSPNVYEARFWYHFTNEYIRPENFRYSKNCGACNLINQNPKYL